MYAIALRIASVVKPNVAQYGAIASISTSWFFRLGIQLSGQRGGTVAKGAVKELKITEQEVSNMVTILREDTANQD